jgi:hypothetical protein
MVTNGVARRAAFCLDLATASEAEPLVDQEPNMAAVSYDRAPHRVRRDLAEAHLRTWDRLASSGTWLDGATRVAVAAAARAARTCGLCQQRKASLSPYSQTGRHDGTSSLPAAWVDIVHRIASDPGRLTRGWFDRAVGEDIEDGAYVELVSIVAHITAIDTFARGIGSDVWPLPSAQSGSPTRYRPSEARLHDAWVPTIAWHEHGPREADYFHGLPANIKMALTLAPDEARGFFDLVAHQYLPGPAMRDFATEYRAITHPQIELIAGRVSALNQCTY